MRWPSQQTQWLRSVWTTLAPCPPLSTSLCLSMTSLTKVLTHYLVRRWFFIYNIKIIYSPLLAIAKTNWLSHRTHQLKKSVKALAPLKACYNNSISRMTLNYIHTLVLRLGIHDQEDINYCNSKVLQTSVHRRRSPQNFHLFVWCTWFCSN